MFHPDRNFRTALKLTPVLFVCGLISLQAGTIAIVTPTQVQYTFTGPCSDCANPLGTLTVLSTYSPGTSLTATNFVSFSYTSSVLNFTILKSDSNLFLSGGLAASLPGMSALTISGTLKNFQSQANGVWCAGPTCSSDMGTAGSWANASASVPEPASVLFVAPAIFALGLIRRRRARKA